MTPRLSPRLLRAARALVGWQLDDAARESGVSVALLEAFESEAGVALSPRSAGKVFAAFERAGVVFIAENGGGAGVRLRRPETSIGSDEATLALEELNASNDE